MRSILLANSLGSLRKSALPNLQLLLPQTSVANDFGYEYVFSRQIEAIANSQDVVIAISTSGNSPNVLEGVMAARDKGCKTIALTGRSGGKLAQIVDISVRIPSNEIARIQEAHITVGHIICAMVEKAFFGES